MSPEEMDEISQQLRAEFLQHARRLKAPRYAVMAAIGDLVCDALQTVRGLEEREYFAVKTRKFLHEAVETGLRESDPPPH
jgi:hypothetical protein